MRMVPLDITPGVFSTLWYVLSHIFVLPARTRAHRPGCAHTYVILLYMSSRVIAQPCPLIFTRICTHMHIYSIHCTSAIHTYWRLVITNQPTFLKYTNANQSAQRSWPAATCGQWTRMCKAALLRLFPPTLEPERLTGFPKTPCSLF